jgi:hypothetical protein
MEVLVGCALGDWCILSRCYEYSPAVQAGGGERGVPYVSLFSLSALLRHALGVGVGGTSPPPHPKVITY